jgi:hypothetical protein
MACNHLLQYKVTGTPDTCRPSPQHGDRSLMPLRVVIEFPSIPKDDFNFAANRQEIGEIMAPTKECNQGVHYSRRL